MQFLSIVTFIATNGEGGGELDHERGQLHVMRLKLLYWPYEVVARSAATLSGYRAVTEPRVPHDATPTAQ